MMKIINQTHLSWISYNDNNNNINNSNDVPRFKIIWWKCPNCVIIVSRHCNLHGRANKNRLLVQNYLIIRIKNFFPRKFKIPDEPIKNDNKKIETDQFRKYASLNRYVPTLIGIAGSLSQENRFDCYFQTSFNPIFHTLSSY